MATTSKRISELTPYVKAQFDSNWQTCVLPANFVDVEDPGGQYPDTFKVAVSSLALNFKDGYYSGVLTVLKTLSADAPFLLGTTTNQSGTFIYKATTTTADFYTSLTTDSNTLPYTVLPFGKSWFFKAFIIGVDTVQNKSTNIEFTGLIKRDSSVGSVSIVGTPTKMIHSREDLTTDATIEADNIETAKTLKINVKGGSPSAPYNWTAKLDIVQI
jgi:hypothetical protein